MNNWQFYVIERRGNTEGQLLSKSARFLATIALCSILCSVGKSQDQPKAPFDVASAEAKARQGDVNAMTKLGEAYWGKQGIPADMDKAKMWLERAAEAGSVEAQMVLGSAYLSGSGLPKDNVLAAKYLLRVAQRQNVDASDQGSQALAQNWIAMMYENGLGLEKSHEKAIQFLQQAANNGNYPAQFNLGSLYNQGSGGMPMDKAIACQWFEKAANSGHVRAMHNTGYCYQVGTGCKQDTDKAIHYYTLAAEAGLTSSQHNLGMLYGVMGNAEKAYFWLRVAQSSGYAEDQSRFDAAKARMSASQLEQQDKAVAAWIEAHKTKTAGKPIS
jgi:TPR repeat protein